MLPSHQSKKHENGRNENLIKGHPIRRTLTKLAVKGHTGQVLWAIAWVKSCLGYLIHCSSSIFSASLIFCSEHSSSSMLSVSLFLQVQCNPHPPCSAHLSSTLDRAVTGQSSSPPCLYSRLTPWSHGVSVLTFQSTHTTSSPTIAQRMQDSGSDPK